MKLPNHICQHFDLWISGTLDVTINNVTAEYDLEADVAQDGVGSTITSGSNDKLTISSSKWQRIAINHNLTPASVIEFDYELLTLGEIQGVGFDTGPLDFFVDGAFFQLAGTQSLGNTSLKDNTLGARSISIPIGDYLVGPTQYLYIVADDDANEAGLSALKTSLSPLIRRKTFPHQPCKLLATT